jgi:hypothetical protein
MLFEYNKVLEVLLFLDPNIDSYLMHTLKIDHNENTNPYMLT